MKILFYFVIVLSYRISCHIHCSFSCMVVCHCWKGCVPCLWLCHYDYILCRKPPEKPPEKKGKCSFYGDHGYDNKINSMQVRHHIPMWLCHTKEMSAELLISDIIILSLQTIFLGYGPSFNFKTKVPAFENIELYNIMCGKMSLFLLIYDIDLTNTFSVTVNWVILICITYST